MCHHTKKERIPNNCIRGDIGGTPIEKMTPKQLWWFGLWTCTKKAIEAPMRRVNCKVFSPVKRREGDQEGH